MFTVCEYSELDTMETPGETLWRTRRVHHCCTQVPFSTQHHNTLIFPSSSSSSQIASAKSFGYLMVSPQLLQFTALFSPIQLITPPIIFIVLLSPYLVETACYQKLLHLLFVVTLNLKIHQLQIDDGQEKKIAVL